MKTSTPVKSAIILGHALVGWMYCGALIGIGRQFMSMQATLVTHAIGAPLGFALVSLLYFRRFAFTSPLQTALLFLGVVVGLDVFVVALLIEKSFAMFASPLGTWVPFALIFSATYATGVFFRKGKSHPHDEYEGPEPERPAGVNLRLLTAEIAGMFTVFALALFLAAGTLAWTAGWVFLALFFGFTIAISLWLLRHNPGLLTERMTGIGKPGQKTWDKVFYALASVFFLVWLVLMPLDAVRFHWSRMPDWLQAAGAILLLCSFYLFFLTFRENPYLSPAVRLQPERGQTVVSTGPYRHVRHPMYAALIPYVLGTALLLGSWYGLLYGLLFMAGVARRAVLEERMLRAELPGYDAYMVKVKYRLIPHVW